MGFGNRDSKEIVIIYSVTITIEPSVEREWLDWMRRVHIPDVLRTGCFVEAHIYKARDPSNALKYVILYHCASLDDYERYRNDFAPALQKQHSDLFHGRFQASRQILEEVT